MVLLMEGMRTAVNRLLSATNITNILGSNVPTDPPPMTSEPIKVDGNVNAGI